MNIKISDPRTKKVVIGLLIILGFALGFFLPRPVIIWTKDYLSPEDAAYRAIYFLQQEVLEEGTSIELISVERDNNLYRLKMKIDDQDFLSYLTRDAKFLFPSVLNLNPPSERSLLQNQKPKIDLFVMSLDPGANQIENILKIAVDQFAQDIAFELHYIVLSEQEGGYYCWDENKQYCSLWGVAEIDQTIRELCLAKHQPDKLWDFITAVNNETLTDDSVNNVALINDRWISLASALDINVALIESCQEEEASSLLQKQSDLRQQKYPVRTPRYYVDSFGEYQNESVIGPYSATLIINGMIYGQNEELLSLTEDNYRDIICSAFIDKYQPDICHNFSEKEEDIQAESEAPLE